MHKKVLSGILMSMVASGLLFAEGDLAEGTLETPQSMQEWLSEDIYTLGLKVGSLGVGIDISKPINQEFSLRVNANGALLDYSGTQEQVDYDTQFELSSIGLLGDYYPVESLGFRLSAGVYYNASEINAQGRSAGGIYTIDGVDYTVSEVGSLNAKVDFEKFAPYFGFGWGDNTHSEGFGFSLDVGALVGNPTVDLVATRGIVSDVVAAEIQTSVQNEENTLNDDLNKLNIYPVVMLGVTYTF